MTINKKTIRIMKILLLGLIVSISLLLASFTNLAKVNNNDNSYSKNQLIVIAEDGYIQLEKDLERKYP